MRNRFLSSPAVKNYWLTKEELLIIGGVLYHERLEGSEKDLVMPESLYVLMICDQLTKWVECVPLPSKTVEVTAKNNS